MSVSAIDPSNPFARSKLRRSPESPLAVRTYQLQSELTHDDADHNRAGERRA
jgi:hypothetical protein